MKLLGKKIFCMVSLIILCSATMANSYTWNEAVDAGALMNTSQDTTGGTGALTTITGLINGDYDADLYKIYISDPVNFTATTVTGPNPGVWTAPDTMLFLFNASGTGLMGDDDVIIYTWAQSTLSKGTTLQPTAAGYYYLGVSAWNNQPVDSNGNKIFGGAEAYATVLASIDGNLLIPPLSTNALSSWSQDSPNYGSSGAYTITLQGVSAVPLPGALVLLGAGLVRLAAYSRRKKAVI